MPIPFTNENFYELAWRVRTTVCDELLAHSQNLDIILNGIAEFEVKNHISFAFGPLVGDTSSEPLQYFDGNGEITPHSAEVMSAQEREVAVSDEVKRSIEEIIKRMEFIASHIDEDTQAVVELGCGYGPNLFRLAKLLGNTDIKFIGAEYTESGRNLCKKLAALPNAAPIQVEFIDHKQPDLSFINEFDNVLIFTCHSIEQVKHIPDNYFEALANSAKHVKAIHLEPFGFQMDNTSTTSKIQEQAFIEKGWNLNFFDCLLAAQKSGTIEVLDTRKDVYGLQQKKPASVAVWDNQTHTKHPTRPTGGADTTDISERLAQGFRYQSLGELPQAKAVYEGILKTNPKHADAQYLLGMLALQTGFTQPGTQYLIHAVNNGCTEASLFTNLAKNFSSQNNPSDAHNILTRGVGLHPDHVELLIMLGSSLRNSARLEQSLNTLTHALDIDGNSSETHLEIARTYQDIGTYDQAEEHYKNAISLTPNVTTRNFYGTFLAHMEREDEAIEQFREAIESNPSSESTLNNLGFHLYALGQIDESIGVFERCLKLNPNNAETHALYAFPLLLKGEYTKGWKEYEWRFKTPTFPHPPLKLDSPMWQNEPLEGKSILLIGEQGFGDTFQFVRFADQLKAMGANVLVAALAPAIELLKNTPGVDEVITLSEANVPAHDYHVYMMSLPERLDVTLATIPQTVPYLFPDKGRVATWKDYFASYDTLKVGIVWSGNPDQRNNVKRSCPLAALSPLLGVDNVQLFSLAKDYNDAEAPLPPEIIDLGGHLNSFSDTAAIIANLDLVISVCTSTAHLAGALGCPVWVLLAASADWRWLLDRDDSPWYPTARLFRQDKLHDWDQLLQRVARNLASQERQKLLT